MSATDRQKLLNTITIGSAVYETIRQAGPIAYYKLDETASGTASTQEAGNSADVLQDTLKQKSFGTVPENAIKWGEGTGPAVDGSSAVMLAPTDRSNGIGLTTTFSNPMVNANAATLLGFFNGSSTDGLLHTLFWLQDSTNGRVPRGYVQIGGTPGTNLYAEASITSEGSTLKVTATKTGQYFDGKTHLLAATAALTGGQLVVTLFIDGVQQAQATGATTVAQFPSLTMCAVGCQPTAAYITAGTYSNAAWFDYALDGDTIADVNSSGTTAFAGDTVDERIGRLAAWEGQGNLDLDTSDTVLGRHMPDSQSLQSAIQQAANSEGGTTYVGGDGEIKFLTRLSKESTHVPLITLSAERVGTTLSKTTDDALLVNKPVVKRLDTAVTATVIDQESSDIHGEHSKDFDTILSSNADAQNYATYVLAFYGKPQPRCDQVEIECLTLQDWAHVLQVDMWQIIRITSMPSSEQSTTLDLFIEGWELSIMPESWKLISDTSTAIPFGILNDTVRGVCGASVVGW
ncbi:MAG TPA: hypothetical protein VIV60_25685 [Polyangiaceae bacterium]